MRVIFDENVPAPLRGMLRNHSSTTVQEQGWAGLTNGELLNQVDGIFDVLVLADKNLRYQQNMAGRRIALVELPTNRWPVLVALVARIDEAISQARPGTYTRIEA